MSIIGAILAKVLADRKGLPPEVANRFLVTGYVVGSATSPILSAIVSERLTQQEADKLATAPIGSSPPSGDSPSPPMVDSRRPDFAFIAKNYIGQQYEEVEKALKTFKINVVKDDVDVTDDESKYRKGVIVGQLLLIGKESKELLANTAVTVNSTLLFLVKANESSKTVPDIEGKTPSEAKTDIEKEGFIYGEKDEVRAKKWLKDNFLAITKDGDVVFDQDPEAGTSLEIGKTVTAFILRKENKDTPTGPVIK